MKTEFVNLTIMAKVEGGESRREKVCRELLEKAKEICGVVEVTAGDAEVVKEGPKRFIAQLNETIENFEDFYMHGDHLLYPSTFSKLLDVIGSLKDLRWRFQRVDERRGD